MPEMNARASTRPTPSSPTLAPTSSAPQAWHLTLALRRTGGLAAGAAFAMNPLLSSSLTMASDIWRRTIRTCSLSWANGRKLIVPYSGSGKAWMFSYRNMIAASFDMDFDLRLCFFGIKQIKQPVDPVIGYGGPAVQLVVIAVQLLHKQTRKRARAPILCCDGH